MGHHLNSGLVTPTAAGSELTYTPTKAAPWKLLCLSAQIVTSATVGNRAPALQFFDQNGTLVCTVPASGTTAASLTVIYSWYIAGAPSPGAGAVVGGFASAVLPNIWFGNGWSFKTKTVNIDTTDQWSAVYATWLMSDNISIGELNALIAASEG